MDTQHPDAAQPGPHTTAGQPVTATQPPAAAAAPKAQSEIGPTTFGGPNGPVHHGANDPETKAAYAAGHPSHGIAAQRAAAGKPATTSTPAPSSTPSSTQTSTPATPATPAPGHTNPPPTETPHS